ncbi:MAG TPA: hypothetical protein VFO40_10090 [Chthoniobacterales bacterium]|jgi:hypothetical protein|nr:hypothetical protein [Chthoniobacterales bacterium]
MNELIQEHFAESNDHIMKLEERIAKQRELIAGRSAVGLSTEVEEKLLANFTKTLEAEIEQRWALIIELEKARLKNP